MNCSAPDLATILDKLGIDVRGLEILTIVADSNDLDAAAAVHSVDQLQSADSIPRELRADLGIVAGGLDDLTRRDAAHLLSRLRDVHCKRVLLVYGGSEWTREDLLALGYLETERPPGGGRCYIFDPDLFSQPREWNNPSKWANPENFRKYRW